MVARGVSRAHPHTAPVAQVSKPAVSPIFQIGNALRRHSNYSRFADLEIRDTADWEVGATEGRCADAPTRALVINSHSPIPSSFCVGTGLVTSASTFQFAGGDPKCAACEA